MLCLLSGPFRAKQQCGPLALCLLSPRRLRTQINREKGLPERRVRNGRGFEGGAKVGVIS
jgi:hypothetical protein